MRGLSWQLCFWLLWGLPTPPSLYACIPCQSQGLALASIEFCVPSTENKAFSGSDAKCWLYDTGYGLCFPLKRVTEGKNTIENGYSQTTESAGKWPHCSVLVSPLDLSSVRVWEELTACLVKVLHVIGKEAKAERVGLDSQGLRDRGFFKGWESDRNDRVGLVYNSSLNQPSKGIRRRDSPTTEPLLPVCCPNPWHNGDSMQCGLQMQQDIMPLPHSVGHGPQLNCNVSVTCLNTRPAYKMDLIVTITNNFGENHSCWKKQVIKEFRVMIVIQGSLSKLIIMRAQETQLTFPYWMCRHYWNIFQA